jgi:hypothetical protein
MGGSDELVNRGVPYDHIESGQEWGGEYVYDKGGRRLREAGTFTEIEFPPTSMVTPQFVISEYRLDGYHVVEERQYTLWLEPGRTRTVFVQEQR